MIYFVVNPRAQSGRGGLFWKRVKRELDLRDGLEYRFVYTRYAGHMTEIVRRLTASLVPKHLVVIGGDGSFNEAICGLQNGDVHRISFLPAGSANDLGKSLGLSSDCLERLDEILSGKDAIRLDLGEVSYDLTARDREKQQKRVRKERGFAVSAGIGFDAAICQDINTGRLKKIFNRVHLGSLAYPIIGLRQLICWRPQYGLLWIDEEKEPIYLDRFLFLSAHIHPFEGGGFPFCPEADYQDGYLDLCVVSGLPVCRLLPLIPLAKKGLHVGKDGVLNIRCKKARILLEYPVFVHTDGEVPGRVKSVAFSAGEMGYWFL